MTVHGRPWPSTAFRDLPRPSMAQVNGGPVLSEAFLRMIDADVKLRGRCRAKKN